MEIKKKYILASMFLFELSYRNLFEQSEEVFKEDFEITEGMYKNRTVDFMFKIFLAGLEANSYVDELVKSI